MKTIFCYFALLLTFTGFSQNPISFGNNPIPNSRFQSRFSTLSVSPLSFTIGFSNQKNYVSGYVLQIYNPTTQMNDQFVRVNDTYYMSNLKSFSNYGFDGMKIDSLNPYGASDVGSALATGLINLLISSKNGF
ncbi:hypothetical protein [Flavobacterium sp. XGLA_31]|uniref:hypothetical protein n=1 Tax=Flavobacterium sp. XGLA_31 TaxID=3447666 RepID=UPI003F37B14A